jgi:hypothetical protein
LWRKERVIHLRIPEIPRYTWLWLLSETGHMSDAVVALVITSMVTLLGVLIAGCFQVRIAVITAKQPAQRVKLRKTN